MKLLPKVCLSLFAIFSDPVFAYSTHFGDPLEWAPDEKERYIDNLRQGSIQDMENKIKGTCLGAKERVFGFIYDVRREQALGNYSKDRADQQISRDLNTFFYYHYNSIPTESFDYDSVAAFDKFITKLTYAGVNKETALDISTMYCDYVTESDRYMRLFSDSRHITNRSYIPSLDGVKNKSENSALPLLDNKPINPNSKIFSRKEIEKLKLDELDVPFIVLLVNNDIKAGLTAQNKSYWFLQQTIIKNKLNDIKQFIQNGGKREEYMLILVTAKGMRLAMENKEQELSELKKYAESVLPKTFGK